MPKGNNIPLTIEEMQEIAQTKNGQCLSKEYKNAKEYLLWKCFYKHEWKASPYSVKAGSWCPYCSGKKGTTIASLQKIVDQYGGKILSKEYLGIKKKHKWQCSSGHIWDAAPDKIKSGKWCSICSRRGSSLGERISREILELMFDSSFVKRRPDWLNGLELDGFCEERKIAFEYQGEQHYKTNNRHSVEQLYAQKERDALKAKICLEHNISLIVIPEFKNTKEINYCIKEIEISVLCCGLKIPEKWKTPKEPLKIWLPLFKVFGTSKLKRMQEAAQKKEGNLLSCEALNSGDFLLWKCKKEHEWKAKANDILNGKWCLKCFKTSKWQTIDDMQKLAKEKGGKFLSLKYTGSQHKHTWQCSQNHIWEASPALIKQRTWCPVCSRIRAGEKIKKNNKGKLDTHKGFNVN